MLSCTYFLRYVGASMVVTVQSGFSQLTTSFDIVAVREASHCHSVRFCSQIVKLIGVTSLGNLFVKSNRRKCCPYTVISPVKFFPETCLLPGRDDYDNL